MTVQHLSFEEWKELGYWTEWMRLQIMRKGIELHNSGDKKRGRYYLKAARGLDYVKDVMECELFNQYPGEQSLHVFYGRDNEIEFQEIRK